MRIRTTASTPSPAPRRCHPDLTRRILLPAPTGRGRFWHPPSTRGSSLEHFSVRGRRSLQVLLHIWPLQSTTPPLLPLKSVCCKTILNSCPCRKPKRKMVLKGFWLNLFSFLIWIQVCTFRHLLSLTASCQRWFLEADAALLLLSSVKLCCRLRSLKFT